MGSGGTRKPARAQRASRHVVPGSLRAAIDVQHAIRCSRRTSPRRHSLDPTDELDRRGITVLVKGARAEHGRILTTARVLADLDAKGHLFDDLDAAIAPARRHVDRQGPVDQRGAAQQWSWVPNVQESAWGVATCLIVSRARTVSR